VPGIREPGQAWHSRTFLPLAPGPLALFYPWHRGTFLPLALWHFGTLLSLAL